MNLLSYFGIENFYDILGHSWGGMLGAGFVVCRQSVGLKHLIPANSLTEMHSWERITCTTQEKMLAGDPRCVARERGGRYHSFHKYQEAKLKFYENVCVLGVTDPE